MEDAWAKIYLDEPFNYQYYDQRIATWYQQEKHTSALLKWIMGVSIFISSLGLLGLALLLTNHRTKEIGIRKVLGASITSVVILFSNGLIKLVVIAVVLSIPVTWFVVLNWLTNFAYPIDIKWWMFALPAFFVLTITTFTIGSQILKIALANPVDALRNE
jgi:ABC-type antimicrobial peptide transport system permease subunit